MEGVDEKRIMKPFQRTIRRDIATVCTKRHWYLCPPPFPQLLPFNIKIIITFGLLNIISLKTQSCKILVIKISLFSFFGASSGSSYTENDLNWSFIRIIRINAGFLSTTINLVAARISCKTTPPWSSAQ